MLRIDEWGRIEKLANGAIRIGCFLWGQRERALKLKVIAEIHLLFGKNNIEMLWPDYNKLLEPKIKT